MKKFIVSMLSDERGAISSKLIIGFICTLVLCTSLIILSIVPNMHQPPDVLIQSIATLASVCIIGSTIDKFSFKSLLKNK